MIMQTEKIQLSGSDPLGRYYTHSLVSKTLVREMNLSKPSLVVDLGTGDGSLSAEAAQIWTSARFITVDIDNSITKINNHRLKEINAHHFEFDVLNSQLHQRIGLDLASVDGAICNPPYIRPRWRKDFAEILEDAGLSGVFPSIKDVGADVLFIAQNLRLLRQSGRLGLILPDGIVAGQKYAELRKTLINQHKIERIIELPRRIFRKTDAKAHIMILTKNGQSDKTIAVERMDIDGSLSKRIQVSIDQAISRADYSYIESQQSQEKHSRVQLNNIYEALARGQLSSVQVRKSNINIFHSTDFPSVNCKIYPCIPDKFILKKPPEKSLKTIIAKAGDILICRVGRNLEEKICFVPNGYVALSDCVYKLQLPTLHTETVLNFLCSQDGRNQLKALTHGVGAKFLTKNDILSLMIKV